MSKSKNNAINFLKRNAVYFILALCIIAIGFSVTFAVIRSNRPTLPEADKGSEEVITPVTPEEPNDPVGDPTPDVPSTPVAETVTFIMPVNNAAAISEYSETMVFNGTLNRYSVHMAIDFFAEEGTPVYAVWDGTVESVTNDLLKGVTVTVDHGNGLKTVYNSLADADAVVAGQKVKKGDVIGEVSVTNRHEYSEGAHLHFEVYENDKIINPSKYLTIDEK